MTRSIGYKGLTLQGAVRTPAPRRARLSTKIWWAIFLGLTLGMYSLFANERAKETVEKAAFVTLAPANRALTFVTQKLTTLWQGYIHNSNAFIHSQKLEKDLSTLGLSYQKLSQENTLLRSLLPMVKLQKNLAFTPVLTTKVLKPWPWITGEAYLIAAGTQEGIQPNCYVVSPQGLVGRITTASSHNATLMMLDDARSRTPIMIAATGQKAILTGQGRGQMPLIELLQPKAHHHREPAVGDRILTSGDDGLYAPYIRIGTLKRCQKNWCVQLFSHEMPLNHVMVIAPETFPGTPPSV